MVSPAGGVGVPGVRELGGYREGLYRVPTRPVSGPIFSHILRLRAYLRPNEGNFMTFDEVSKIGSRIDLRLTSELTQIALRYLSPDWSPDGPQIPISKTSDIQWSIIGVI